MTKQLERLENEEHKAKAKFLEAKGIWYRAMVKLAGYRVAYKIDRELCEKLDKMSKEEIVK